MTEPTLPRAILVVGPAGSGKSTVARAVARLAGAAYLDKDTLCGPLVGALLGALGESPDARESSDVYVAQVMPVEYRTLLAVAADNLRLGGDVVIDAPFAGMLEDPGFLARLRSDTDWPPADAVVVVVRTPSDVARARLMERGLDRDRAKLRRWEDFWLAHGNVECSWDDATTVEVDNGEGLDLAAISRLLHR